MLLFGFLSQSRTQGTQGSLCTILHACRNIMATTASVRFVPVSCFIYRSEEAKACDKWSIFVKIKLKETMVDLRERFALNDYGGFKKQSRWKARLSARCKAQEA